MEWLKESGNEFTVGVFVLMLEKVVSPVWQYRHRIGQSRFVASLVGFYRRERRRFRNVCLRESARFRDLPIAGQIGLSIFVAGCLPAIFWMSTSPGASAESAPAAIMAAWTVGCIAAISIFAYGLTVLMHRRIMGLIRR